MSNNPTLQIKQHTTARTCRQWRGGGSGLAGLGQEERGERGRVLTDAPCRGEAEVGVVVVTGVVLPRRLLVGGGSAGGGAPVDVALVHEGRTWPCQKCAQQDEEKEGIEKRTRGCVSSPESEEGLRRRGGLRRRIPAAWGRGNEGRERGMRRGARGILIDQ